MKWWMIGGAWMLSTACSEGEGKVVFTTWGEEYIEEELPASEFEDGWSVTFDKFLVSLTHIEVADGDQVGASFSQQTVYDMTLPGKKTIFEASLAAKSWPNVSFRIAPASGQAIAGGNTSEADRAAMAAAGYSLYVEGRGRKDGVEKRFAWGFSTDTLYRNCRGEVSGREVVGAEVTNGGTDTMEITLHGDHLFYDDLASDQGKLRFVNVAAADANDDGEVTLEELAAVDRADLIDGPYGVGGAAAVLTYADFLTALTRTVGHFRGEGECEL